MFSGPGTTETTSSLTPSFRSVLLKSKRTSQGTSTTASDFFPLSHLLVTPARRRAPRRRRLGSEGGGAEPALRGPSFIWLRPAFVSTAGASNPALRIEPDKMFGQARARRPLLRRTLPSHPHVKHVIRSISASGVMADYPERSGSGLHSCVQPLLKGPPNAAADCCDKRGNWCLRPSVLESTLTAKASYHKVQIVVFMSQLLSFNEIFSFSSFFLHFSCSRTISRTLNSA